MADIIRITIKGESGYGPVDEAYDDEGTYEDVLRRLDTF